MREVTFGLTSCSREDVDRLFQQNGYAGPFEEPDYRWFYPNMDDPVLYIKLYTPDIFTEFCSEEELRLIVQVTGITPSVFVYVEITGRHPGREEVLELVKELSSRFKGYGFDEYSSYDYFWTLEEIKDGVPKEGFLFFDYLARYKAEKKKSQPDR